MPDGKRLWRTDKGDLVEDGHAEARLLAYGADDALSDADAKQVGKASAKKAAAPADKQAPKAADKQAAQPKTK